MDVFLGLILIITPIILAFVLLLIAKKPADTTGLTVWLVTCVIAILAFQTNLGVVLVASLAGIVRSFPISLMVATSILMMTYMQETGALQRMIVYFKTLGGGNRPLQIMLINIGLGLFLVGIGATPVSMLPPVMLALGFSPLCAVALPSIGYDPLTTFALLGVPAIVFQGTYADSAGLLIEDFPLWQSGSVFAMYMPVITTGIALSMLWIAGGKKLLMNREGIILALLSGITAGGVAIIANMELVAQTELTNVFAGIAVIGVLFIYTRVRKRSFIDRSSLNEKDKQIEHSMSLKKASIPWAILIALCFIVYVVPIVKNLLLVQLRFPIQVFDYPSPIGTSFLGQAYTLMLVATLLSIPFFKTEGRVMRSTISKFSKRAPRPVLAAAIFFAMAEVMNYSGWFPGPTGWEFPTDPTNNMIYLLATTSSTLGVLYPLTVPFIGLLAGFISGSETSAIAIFTDYHYQTSNLILADSLVVSASNGIGGGLASVLSPAKIQNAAAVIDEIGIEGDVIRYGAVIALLMTLVTAILTLIWAFT